MEYEFVDGLPVRCTLDRWNNTEKCEVLFNGKWRVLWSARPTSKGGASAWVKRQNELVQRVWEVQHGIKARTCKRCGLMLEGEPKLWYGRPCRLCQERSGVHAG